MDNVVLEPDLRPIYPFYPDIGPFFVFVMKKEEILAEKVRAILTRKGVKARDIYDIYFLTERLKTELQPDLIEKKLSYYDLAFKKQDLSDRISNVTKKEWNSELSNIMRSVPDYPKTIHKVLRLIDELKI